MDAGKDTLPEFGKYRAVREIGRGATSVVYLAEEMVEGRTSVEEATPENPFPNLNWSDDALKPARVAVKLVDFTDDGSKLARRFRKLFATEAAVSSQFDHPNITRVFDWKVEENRAYLVMEYLDGDTLDQFITMDKLLPMHRTVGIIFKVAMALDYAHRRGIVNRDIKPANVMLLKDDEVKVMDFGLALNIKKNVNVDSTFINGLGSPSYMSPEQIKGYTLNHQTDLYSLGVMFYQLLTGRLPFRATNTASLIYKIVNMEAVPVTQLNPDIPELTNKVIAKAMEKDLYSRYRLGSDMAKDLSAVRYQILEEDQVVPNEERWKAIRGLPILGQLDDTDIWELLRLSHWRELAPATVLMREGEEGKSFGFVLEGELEIEKGRHAIDKAGRGDLLGVMEWLDSEGSTRDLSATALTRVVFLEVNQAAFAFATEELAGEIRRLATDAMLKNMRAAMLLAKRVSPLAIHPAPDDEEVPEVANDATGVAVPVANSLGWGAFAAVAAAVPEPEGPAPATSVSQMPVTPAAPAQARPTTVVVQPMPAAAAATIAQLVMGRAPVPAPQAFHLNSSETTEFTDVPLLPDEEPALSAPAEEKTPGEPREDAMLTTEMAPRFNATTAFATSEMAPNFMSTSAMPDAQDAAPVAVPSELAPDFDVHQGSATSEMAPDFAGTTAFDPPMEEVAPEPEIHLPAFDLDQAGMATSEMAPSYAGTNPFDASDFDLPQAPAAPAVRSTVPAAAKAQAAGITDYAATVAFDAAELMALPVAAAPTPVAPASVANFDPDKTMILSGGFDRSSDKDGKFTEELYPPVSAASAPVRAASMASGIVRARVKPPEDFDKTVEISGGFESQPLEDEAPLDDLFPPIKF